MAKNVAFAHVVAGFNVENKHKIHYSNLFVPYDLFFMGHMHVFHCLREFWKQLKILSVRSPCQIAS